MSIKYVKINSNSPFEIDKPSSEQSVTVKNCLLSDDDLEITDSNNKIIARFADGHIKTKNFDSAAAASKSEIESSVVKIDVASSDKIGIFSNSFMNGYCMYNHHAINNVSMFTDWIFYNYAKSGDTVLDNLIRLNSDSKWLGDVKPSDWNITYGIIAMNDNDYGYWGADHETYYQNFKKLEDGVKTLGAVPILATEHDDIEFYPCLTRLSNENGYDFVYWGKTATLLYKSVFKPFWWHSHPSTRTAWMWTYGFLPEILKLPRPSKSIKIFRIRNAYADSPISDLTFDDNYGRAKRFIEIGCGVTSLKKADEKYFDRLDVLESSSGLYSEDHKDEYQKLQSGNSVNVGKRALVQIVTPYSSAGLTSLKLVVKSENLKKAYVLSTLGISSMFVKQNVVAFGIASGADKIKSGDEFEITGGVQSGSGLVGNYTVGAIYGSMLLTTTSSSGKTLSGTDKPSSNINDLSLSGSYSYPNADYMQRFQKPLKEWVEVPVQTDGMIDLTGKLKTAMDFDKATVLLESDADITFENVYAEATGNREKPIVFIRETELKNGTELLQSVQMDDSWTFDPGIADYVPVTSTDGKTAEPFPADAKKVKIIHVGESAKTTVNGSEIAIGKYEPAFVQIKLIARYFPKYVASDSDFESTEIDEQSFDCALVDMYLKYGSSRIKVARFQIGAWWNIFAADVLVNKTIPSEIEIVCADKSVQIAECSLQLI